MNLWRALGKLAAELDMEEFCSQMAKLEALLFDVDGTLADTERNGHRVAFNAAFAAAGLDWHWSESLYGRLLEVTGGKERIRYFLDEFHGDAAQAEVDDAFIARLHREKTAQYKALVERGELPLRPGVRRLLEAARAAGLRLAIATTTTPENVTALLTSTLGKDAEPDLDATRRRLLRQGTRLLDRLLAQERPA